MAVCAVGNAGQRDVVIEVGAGGIRRAFVGEPFGPVHLGTR